MCQFFSFVATKDKLYAYYGVNGHEDIIAIAGLSDRKEVPDFVRCEFTPDKPMTVDFSKWGFKVDQDVRPEWFVESEWRDRAIEFLLDKLLNESITEDIKIGYGQYWFCCANVDKFIGTCSVLYMCESSNVGLMQGASKVGEMWGASKVGEMWESSNVGLMRESSKVGEMRGASNVGLMRESSNVGLMRGASNVGLMRESSKVGEMRGASNVGLMRGASKVGEMWGASNVGEMWESSNVGLMRESSKVNNDCRKR